MNSAEFTSKTNDINNWIGLASQMQEPTFNKVQEFMPSSLTNDLFVQVVKKF